MKFTLDWLKAHLDTDASLEEICDKLTAIGLEIEGVEDRAATYAPFKVAYVESAEKHPDADKLKVCQVKTADHGTLQIVCGAPNAKAGMKVIFAPNGSYIPGLDITLKKAEIRGVESNGMMVSEKEMLLSDEHKGIIEVDEKHEIGTPMAEIYGLVDPVIEINLTPNRADCAGVYGIARDLAAAGMGTLKPVHYHPLGGTYKSSIGVKIEDEGCVHFVGREIKNIKNGPSPDWMQALLKAVGLRPINALVDITNFINLDHARPLHVYDADKINGDIVAKSAQGGEDLDALNDKSYTLLEGSLVITDSNGVIGLAGIVGGTSTSSELETTNIFLECAYFEPSRIARTGRDLGVNSDARYRFERGVDPEFTRPAMDLFTHLVFEICGTPDTKVSEVVEAGAPIEWRREINYDPSYFENLIGFEVEAHTQKTILHSLGFTIADSGKGWVINPPSWRGDVEGKADITEEIARIIGLDALPAVSVRADDATTKGAETLILSRVRAARAALTSRGLDECVSWSFTGENQARAFGCNDNALTALSLKNPISNEMNVMRPSALPLLIEAATRNSARGFAGAALCEIGPVFKGVKPEDQVSVASGIRAGAAFGRHWADKDATRSVDLYDAKADALAALEAAGAPAANAQVRTGAAEYFHPGRSGVIALGKTIIAQFGELHPAVLEELNVKFPVVGFEVFLENIPAAKKKSVAKPMLTLEPLQPLTKDFAFIVDESREAIDVLRAAMAADKKLISGGNIFDIYQGKGVDEGKKSVAIALTLQPRGESLTDKDIEALIKSVSDIVEKKCGGVLRG
ncbi:MAG: phenylalanine--tRNA ligase subunit beta [Micavibrio sp.]|nr:phenylalanine--tRNA ligase subunit beta [Micavibrio sp.]